MKLGTLLTIHKGLGIAKRHCGHKGLAYVDAELEVEAEMQRQLAAS